MVNLCSIFNFRHADSFDLLCREERVLSINDLCSMNVIKNAFVMNGDYYWGLSSITNDCPLGLWDVMDIHGIPQDVCMSRLYRAVPLSIPSHSPMEFHGMSTCPMVDLAILLPTVVHIGSHGHVCMSRLCCAVPLSIPSHSPMIHMGSHGISTCPMVDLAILLVHMGSHGHVCMSRLCRAVPQSIPSHSPMIHMRCPVVDLAILLVHWDPTGMSACLDYAVQSLCPSRPIVPWWYTWDPTGCLHVQTMPCSPSVYPVP